MRNKRLFAVAGLALLVFLSGCSILTGSGEIDQDDLLEDADYDWDRNATVSYDVTTSSLLSFSSNRYQSVVRLENQSTLILDRSTLFRGDRPVSVEALQFQFPNGTVVNATHENLTAVRGSDETEIQVPEANGTVGYTATWGSSTTALGGSPRQWSVNTPVEGSHEVRMPNGSRTDLPFLSRTAPGSHETTVEDDRAVIRWDDEFDSSSIVVRYYLARDLWLFGGLFLIGSAVAIGGTLYYYRAIQRAREKREEVGLDVEYEDNDRSDDGPPPGMR